MKSRWYYDYTLCRVGIAEENGVICKVFFDRVKGAAGGVYEKRETPLIKETAAQLAEYFNGRRKNFNVPLAPRGTAFQIAVWNALQKIPFGETRSYGEIAAMIGNPKASRAVGMANNRNPIVIIIPCHRVIGYDGGMTGFAGGLELKKRLLELERES